MDERRDDWHNSVDTRLVNLTSAQKSADIDLERIHRELIKFDRILRGDPERNIEGQIEALNHLKTEINKFNRIFDKDYLGHGGLISFITYLHDKEKDRSEARSYKWPFWATVIAAAIGLATAGLTHKDEVMKWFPKHKPSPFESMIDRAAHPKNRYHHYTIRVPAQDDDSE
jgi:hypothetical protein